MLVRGRLSTVLPQSRLDPHPLVSGDRDAWRVVEPHTVTGAASPPTPTGGRSIPRLPLVAAFRCSRLSGDVWRRVEDQRPFRWVVGVLTVGNDNTIR